MILVLGCRENRYVVVLWKIGVKMYISRVKLYNWKNFRECDVRLSERCFVVGANATGKSNFLDVFRFLRDIVKEGGGLQAAVNVRGGLKKTSNPQLSPSTSFLRVHVLSLLNYQIN